MAPAKQRAPAPALMWLAADEPPEPDLEADAEAEPLAAAPPAVPAAAVGVGVALMTLVIPEPMETVWVALPTMTVLRPVVRPA